MKKRIHVPELKSDGIVLVKESFIGQSVITGKKPGFYDRISVDSPPLNCLVHAYFGRNNGSWVCPEYRKSVHSSRLYEKTSTLVLDGKIAIVGPEYVTLNKENDIWEIHGGQRYDVELPPEGFIKKFDTLIGLPEGTTQDKKKAEAALGEASFFWKYERGLVVAMIVDSGNKGRFSIKVCTPPNARTLQNQYREYISEENRRTEYIYNKYLQRYSKFIKRLSR
jgi:hypothetical protein